MMADVGEDIAFPLTVVDHEMARGIYRYVHNGMTYITCPGWDRTTAVLDKDIVDGRMNEARKRYADHVAAHYDQGGEARAG